MLERDRIRGNVLSRLEDVEEAVAGLREYARPSEVVVYETDTDWQVLAGWISTGSVLQDLLGRIVLDPTLPRIRIGTGGYIESEDFVSGSAGFQINGGVAEFNDVVVRGTIYATLGEIGGWVIGTHSLMADSGAVGLNSEATGGTDIRIWAGNVTPASAPFRVDEAGNLVASSANITGTIDANAGHLGSLDVDGVVTVGSAAPYIQIDGPNKVIQSSNYSAGAAGMRIGADGNAEFNNVVMRGEMRASVFTVGEIHADGGTILVLEAGVLAEEVTTI
jgi:hypothetical protein